MTWNLSSILPALHKGVDFIEQLVPFATSIGAPDLVVKATQVASAVVETIDNVVERVAEGKVVASSSDQAELKSILGRIQTKNDELRAYIDSH